MISKGRIKQKRKGGGVAVLVRNISDMNVEDIDVGNCDMSEDILATKVEFKGVHGKRESLILLVVYMTVEGERGIRENKLNYNILKRVARVHANERIMIMGDMNAHIGFIWRKNKYKRGAPE